MLPSSLQLKITESNRNTFNKVFFRASRVLERTLFWAEWNKSVMRPINLCFTVKHGCERHSCSGYTLNPLETNASSHLLFVHNSPSHRHTHTHTRTPSGWTPPAKPPALRNGPNGTTRSSTCWPAWGSPWASGTCGGSRTSARSTEEVLYCRSHEDKPE